MPGILSGDRGNLEKAVKKNRCMIEATHVLRRNIKFGAFPKRVGPRILSLQSVDFFGTSEH